MSRTRAGRSPPGKHAQRREFKELPAEKSAFPQLAAESLHPTATCSAALISQTEFMGDYHTAPATLCCGTGNRYAPALNPKRPCYICQACPGDVITALPASEDLVSTLEVAFAAQFSGAKQQGRKMRGKKANYSCLKQKK